MARKRESTSILRDVVLPVVLPVASAVALVLAARHLRSGNLVHADDLLAAADASTNPVGAMASVMQSQTRRERPAEEGAEGVMMQVDPPVYQQQVPVNLGGAEDIGPQFGLVPQQEPLYQPAVDDATSLRPARPNLRMIAARRRADARIAAARAKPTVSQAQATRRNEQRNSHSFRANPGQHRGRDIKK